LLNSSRFLKSYKLLEGENIGKLLGIGILAGKELYLYLREATIAMALNFLRLIK
jgi:hypothetical protein